MPKKHERMLVFEIQPIHTKDIQFTLRHTLAISLSEQSQATKLLCIIPAEMSEMFSHGEL